MTRAKPLTIAILLTTLVVGQTPKLDEGSELRVRLLAPLTTTFSRKGDIVSAKVFEPAKFQGGILEGEIRDVAKASVQFQFRTLHISGIAVPLVTELENVANSKNQFGIDESGSRIETSQKQDAPARSGFPLFHRGNHGEKNPTPHVTGVIRLSTKGPNLALAPGSELLLQVDAKQP